MIQEILTNFAHNLFKPLLLFFYAGFAIPLLRVNFEFPKALYQSLTLYLLLAIGWHGGEELASLSPDLYAQAAGFMVLGFCTNCVIGFVAYGMLRAMTRIRRIDASTIAGYYGSDSAGTFVTCLGFLTASNIAYDSYMPVMLAVMEIPGCLVALILVARLRRQGMDDQGNMRDEQPSEFEIKQGGEVPVEATDSTTVQDAQARKLQKSLSDEDQLALQTVEQVDSTSAHKRVNIFNAKLLHEVFLNPGIFLLFAGVAIGFISRLQGEKVISANDRVFVDLFQGMLCLFLLEMGITASRKLQDLRVGGWQLIAFALAAPNLFAISGMFLASLYSQVTGVPLQPGTYILFGVLCGSASYIAMPAVQRLAIPEASPTLPLAASLGITFSYNVTLGIPIYKFIVESFLT
jgi:uncharacterized protein